MSYFIDTSGRDPMELVPGARTRTFWGEQMLLSLVEIDANSEVPLHTHPHEQGNKRGITLDIESTGGRPGSFAIAKKLLYAGDFEDSAHDSNPGFKTPKGIFGTVYRHPGVDPSVDNRDAGAD